MSNRRVLAKPTKIPKHIWELLGEPILMRLEKREEFEAYLLAVASAVGADDIVSWNYCADVTYQTWDIRRLRSIRAGVLLEAEIEVVVRLMRTTYDDTDDIPSALYSIIQAESEARKWATGGEFGSRIDERFAARGHDRNSVLADAYKLCASRLGDIDDSISDLESRRARTLREIARLDAVRAKRLEQASLAIIEGEFTQADE